MFLIWDRINDDGINMMHDFFFTNPASETKAILQTAETFAPDFTILFHGAGNALPHIIGTSYLFKNKKEIIREFHNFVSVLLSCHSSKFG